MTLLHRLASIARWLVRRDRAERGLDDELRSFVDMAAADRMRGGVPPAEARRLAILELGGLDQTKERVRTSRHGAWIDEIGRDASYACRMFARTPGFTLIVVLTLALGIGANTAIFSLIDALMLRWLPVPSPQELLQVRLQPRTATDQSGETLSYAIVRTIAEQKDIFAGVGGFTSSRLDVETRGTLQPVPSAYVTGGFYQALRLTPAAGRLLTPADDEPGVPVVAVISDGYWERQYARSPDAIGRVFIVSGVPITIVGVSPRGFVGANVGAISDITLPVAALPVVAPSAAPLLGKGNFWLRALARTRDGITAAEASERLTAAWTRVSAEAIAPHWTASRRQAMADAVFRLSSGGTGWTYLRAMYRKPLYVLMAVAGVVLLIACANVASLLLARASARRREIGVRLAIGAGRARIVRQLLVESTLLSLIGAAFGVAIAWLTGRFLVNMISPSVGGVVFDLTPNWHVLLFTTLVAVSTGILFGVAPALQTTAVGPSLSLKDDPRTTGSRSRLLRSLVSAQVAMSLILLAGAGLFIRTLVNLQNLDPGFDTRQVWFAELEARRLAVPQAALDEVRSLPGVASAALTTHTPLSGSSWSEPAVPAGQTVPERDNALFVGAGAGFFETVGIALRSGRTFDSRDTAGSPPVAIVNEAYAQRFFPSRNPVGLRLSAVVRGERRDLEIVGLAENTNTAGLRSAPPATVYVAYSQLTGDFPTSVVVRAATSDARVASDLQALLQSKVSGSSVEVRSLSTQVAATMVRERMMATLAGAFGALALLLACVGLYGLLAYNVVQRTKEIGIRMALGAPRARVVRLVLVGGMRLVVLGVAIGLPIAWAASHSIESMLFALTPTDPATLGGAIALLAIAAQLAAYLPARRAARVDPLVALRHD